MKKITLALALFVGSIGLMNAQSSLTSAEPSSEEPVTVENLLTRLQDIGKTAGNVNDHFTNHEQRMLNVHFNGVQNLAPVVITQSNTQTIEAGAEIACASVTSFRDNNMFRAFDLPGDFGITDGLEVNAVEFAIGTISTPSGFPITANIWSTPGTFPGGTLTLQGTAVYTATNADAATMITLPLSAMIPAGETMVMELVLVDDGTDTNFMRFGCNNDGETGPSYIMADDCGASVPTPFFDLGLSQGLVWNVLGDDEPGGGGGVDPIVFGINNAAETLVSFDPTDATVLDPLGASAATDFENAGAIDPNDNGTAYVLDNAGGFYSVDLDTGAYTLLGNISAPGAENWAGLEFDPTSGDLYAMSTDVANSTLSSIDIAGATATTIGSTGVAGAISLMIDGNGDAYTHDIVSGDFYYVSLADGTASPIGPLGFDPNFGQGGTYLASDPGFVYLSAFDSGAFQSQWRRVDVLTGNATLISLIGVGDEQMGWSSAIGDLIGVAENALEGFSFYPNPTTGNLALKSVKNIDNVAIFNLLGQQVLSAKVDATSTNLDVSRLNVGSYIMQVSVEGQTGTFKFLKN